MLKVNIGLCKPFVSIKESTFPGGEEHISIAGCWGIGNADLIVIRAYLRSSSDVMKLCLLVDALERRFGADVPRVLEMPYLPYARQDRVCHPGEALSIKVFANIINSLGFRGVQVWDAHSDVGVALINHCESTPVENLIPKEIIREKTVLLAPDAGAYKKVQKVAEKYNKFAYYCTKARVGKEIEINVPDDILVKDQDILVIDDICDGGATFVALAKELPDTKLRLWVTHGIFSNGVAPLYAAGYSEIYSTNSWPYPIWGTDIHGKLEAHQEKGFKQYAY